MDLQLDRLAVVVTGGSSGIGRALVADLVGAGALVSTCARNQDGLDALAAEITGPGILHTRRCDVRDRHAVQDYLDEVVREFGRIDGLVNNAGQSRLAPLADLTYDDWLDELDLKFGSILHPTTAALDGLRRSEHPAVVNVNAVLARQPETRLIATSAARAGVLNLTKSLAGELARDGIRVNSICLGLIDSGQWRRRFEEAGTDLTYDEWSAGLAADRGIPLGRIGRPDEVSYVVATLLSPLASYVTGTTIDVAGGVGRYV